MFNIRKSKGNIVTKSVTPSTNTGRQLAATLLENVKLKAALEQVQSPDVVQLPAKQKLAQNAPASTAEVQKQLEQTRIQGHASVLTELDRKAKASQEGYSPSSRFVIRDNNKPFLAMGCPNTKVQQQIGEDNLKLMAAGKRPYVNYEDWVSASGDNSYDIIGSPDVRWEKYTEPVLASATVPVFIARHQYYLMYENDKCFFLAGAMKLPSILRRSASENVSGLTVDNSSILMSVSNATRYRDMSKPEYSDIVASQPCIADLFRVYIQWDNLDKVLMDVSKATTVWSKD
jgi:hypothetical protein